MVEVAANYICYRYRRYERVGQYVGNYRYKLMRKGSSFLIKEKKIVIQALSELPDPVGREVPR